MRRRIRLPLAILMAATSLAAEEKRDLTQLSLEQLMDVEVVYAASKQDQNPRYAPSSITIVPASEIEQFGYRNLGDILRSVRGFYVTNDRNYSYVGVRGFGRPGDYNTRILLLIDGHKLNDNIYESAMIGNEFPLDVALIDRVEVVRGPSSSIYGTNAFFAVVNVITRREAATEASGEAASYGTYRGRVTGATGDGDTQALASATLTDSRGRRLFFREFDSADTNFGITSRTDFEKSRSAFFTLTRGGLRIESLYSMRDKGIPTGSYGTLFNDRRNKTIDGSSWLDVSYERAVGPHLTMQARAHADYYWYDGSYVFDYPPVVVNQDRSRGQWWGSEFMLRSTHFAKQTILAGGEFQDNVRQDQLNYDRDPYYSYLDERHDSRRWAVYAQDEIRLNDRVLINIGVRTDDYNFGSHTSPRAALILTPRHHTTVKLLYGEAFRAPNQYELFYSSEVPVQLANPDLRPEKIKTYEAVIDRFFGSNVQLQTSAFVYTIDGLISLVTNDDESLQFRNADHIDARGVESQLSWRAASGIATTLSYAWQRSETADGSRLTNSPANLAKFSIGFPAMHRVSGGIETQYIGRRLTLSGEHSNAAVLTNATLVAHRISRHVDASFSIYNLFNTNYGDPGSEEHIEDVIQQDGRTFRAKVTWRF